MSKEKKPKQEQQDETGANSSLNLFQRMRNIMDDVKYIQKEDKKVNNQYTFVSHDAVTKLIHIALVKHGVVMLPSVVSHEREGQNGMRTVATVDVTFVNVDDPQDRETITSVGYGIDNQDKGIGKAVSYAVKYAMLKAFCLETGDDPERDMTDFKPSDEKLTEQQCIKVIESLMQCPEGTEQNLIDWLKVDRLSDVPTGKFGQIMDILKQKKAG